MAHRAQHEMQYEESECIINVAWQQALLAIKTHKIAEKSHHLHIK